MSAVKSASTKVNEELLNAELNTIRTCLEIAKGCESKEGQLYDKICNCICIIEAYIKMPLAEKVKYAGSVNKIRAFANKLLGLNQ
jgi:hypothetical protein